MSEELSHEQYKEIEGEIESALRERYFLLKKGPALDLLTATIIGLGGFSWVSASWTALQKWNELRTKHSLDDKIDKIELAAKWFDDARSNTLVIPRDVMSLPD